MEESIVHCIKVHSRNPRTHCVGAVHKVIGYRYNNNGGIFDIKTRVNLGKQIMNLRNENAGEESSKRQVYSKGNVFKIIHGISCLNFTDFFSFANNNNSSRGHPYRLCIPLNKNNTRNFFFSSRVVPAWNSLPASTVAAPNPISFKKALFKLNLSNFLEFPSVLHCDNSFYLFRFLFSGFSSYFGFKCVFLMMNLIFLHIFVCI